MLWRHLRAILIGPVLVTIAIPALIAGTVGTGTVALPQPLAWLLMGLGVVVAGVAMLAWSIGLFGQVGKGTLSPFDPPRTLVVRGPYRHVRNPMFCGVLAILLGEAVAARSPGPAGLVRAVSPRGGGRGAVEGGAAPGPQVRRRIRALPPARPSLAAETAPMVAAAQRPPAP